MKNRYMVWLKNDQACIFDRCEFLNLREARHWAAGRGGRYTVIIEKNGEEILRYISR